MTYWWACRHMGGEEVLPIIEPEDGFRGRAEAVSFYERKQVEMDADEKRMSGKCLGCGVVMPAECRPGSRRLCSACQGQSREVLLGRR